MVYASTSLALAAVETFVNLEPNLRPADLVSIEGEIPDALEIERLDVGVLPARWRETRDESLRRFGDEWIRRGRSAALVVPSAAIRGEWNVLLNPAHARFGAIQFRGSRPFEFDMRMFRHPANKTKSMIRITGAHGGGLAKSRSLIRQDCGCMATAAQSPFPRPATANRPIP